MWSSLTTSALAVVAALFFSINSAFAEDADLMKGGKDYERHCAICHGVGGTGNGPLAEELVKPPADLTGISEKNGGSFPEERVIRTIEYGGGISTHGPSNMLPWGAFFMIEGSAEDAAARIKALANYVKSLQKK